MKKLLAFTLAEVLITLSILGVVAAITVPSLIKRQHKKEFETRLVKVWSTVDHVIGILEAEEGKAFGQWDLSSTNEETIRNKIYSHMNVEKDCRTNSCAYQEYYQDQKTPGENFDPHICLKDGTCLSLSMNNDWSSPYGDITFLIDINGKKGPNARGIDIFWLSIYKDNSSGSYYLGCADYNKRQTPTMTGNLESSIDICKTEVGYSNGGYHCSAWIYSNKLKYPKDYPWF